MSFRKWSVPALQHFLTESPATCLSADFIDRFFSRETHARGFLSLYNLATVSFCRHPSLNFDLAWGIVLLRLEFCWNMHLTVFVWRNRVDNNSSCWKYKLFLFLTSYVCWSVRLEMEKESVQSALSSVISRCIISL